MTSLALACRLGAVTAPRSIPRRVRSILNKYGATLLLPGVSGALRFGYQPGNHRESTGQTLAAADQQVGLVVDAARVPGLNITPNNLQGFTVVFGGGALLSNTSFSSISAGGVQRSLLTVGRIYEIVGSFSQLNQVELSINNASGTKSNTVFQSNGLTGTIRAVFTAIVPEMYFRLAGTSTVTCEFSIRELPGIHASQSTSGFQPVLRNTSGIQSWQFDGTDDRLSLSAVPFQMADDHFAVAAFSPTKNNATYFVPSRKPSGNVRFASVSINAAGVIYSEWYDGTQYIAHTAPATLGSDYVVSSIKQGSVVKSRVNSAQIGNSTAFTTAVQGTEGLIGNGPYGYFEGKGVAVIFGKGAITDSELLTLERFMATLQGRAL